MSNEYGPTRPGFCVTTLILYPEVPISTYIFIFQFETAKYFKQWLFTGIESFVKGCVNVGRKISNCSVFPSFCGIFSDVGLLQVKFVRSKKAINTGKIVSFGNSICLCEFKMYFNGDTVIEWLNVQQFGRQGD